MKYFIFILSLQNLVYILQLQCISRQMLSFHRKYLICIYIS